MMTAHTIHERAGVALALTGTEHRFLRMLAAGCLMEELTAKFDLPMPELQLQLAELQRKLDANTLPQAVAKAVGAGLL